MRPLTDETPKPLLKAGEYSLVEYHLRCLAAAGITEIVMNISWLSEQFHQRLGRGGQLGVEIHYLEEPEKALETGGGIFNALDWLGSSPFWVINGDVWCDYPVGLRELDAGTLAHLVLIDNPEHNPEGDFALDGRRVDPDLSPRLTFSGLSVIHPGLFQASSAGRFPLAPLLQDAAALGQVTGEHFKGNWFDVGTPERLAELDAWLNARRTAPPA